MNMQGEQSPNPCCLQQPVLKAYGRTGTGGLGERMVDDGAETTGHMLWGCVQRCMSRDGLCAQRLAVCAETGRVCRDGSCVQRRVVCPEMGVVCAETGRVCRDIQRKGKGCRDGKGNKEVESRKQCAN